MESSLETLMPYLPMESVKVISPFLEVTLTAGIVTILVESYTFPVSQIWDLATSEVLIINIIRRILKRYVGPIFLLQKGNVGVPAGGFFLPERMGCHLDQWLLSTETVSFHGRIPHRPYGW